jgi:hypothetical protein
MNGSFFKKLFSLCVVALFVGALAPYGYADGDAATKQLPEEKKCADFLLELRKKPSHLEFVSCEAKTIAQLRALRSIYRVEGKHAGDIERYFAKVARLPVLKRNCCLWESTANKVGASPSGALKKGKDLYLVHMASRETIVADRKRWSEIDYFYVSVDFFLEEP